MLGGLGHVLRIGRIMAALARHDALFVLTRLGAPAWIERGVGLLVPPRRDAKRRPGQRAAAALQTLGPSFIKLGQSLGTRSDLVGEQFAADLSALQDKLPPFSARAARAAIGQEFGRPVSHLFQSFDDRPVAAASIAQVHFATLKNGQPVAVKVLRPGIERAFERDLAFFRWIAGLVARHHHAGKRLRPLEVVDILAKSVSLEMDLRFEAAAASELAENLAGDDRVRVPKVYWAETGSRVLTIERVGGIRIDEVKKLIEAGHDPTRVLEVSSALFFTQVFRDGFFHADLHPGNIFVEPDGKIALVDFGIMGRLDRATRHYLADMLLGFLNRDYRRVAEIHFEAGYVPASQSVEAFTQACRSIAEPILELPLSQISVARLLGQLFHVTEAFDMETQPQLLLLQKSMLVAEGLGRVLNPAVNMWELTRPLIESWMRQNRGPEARARDAIQDLAHTARRLPQLVAELERALSDAARNGLKLHPETVAALAQARHEPGVPRPSQALGWVLAGAGAGLGAALAWGLMRFIFI